MHKWNKTKIIEHHVCVVTSCSNQTVVGHDKGIEYCPRSVRIGNKKSIYL